MSDRTHMEPIQLADIVRDFAGLWVAVKQGQVVEAAETPGLLSLRLSERGIGDATIVRSPALDESDLVGLG